MRTLHSLHTVDVAPGELGVTVRNGNKWLDAQGDDIELCECLNSEHKVVGHAKVEFVWYGMFYDIPARFIENEHELSSRLYSGLLDSMRRAYGSSFAENSPVVVLTYKRID